MLILLGEGGSRWLNRLPFQTTEAEKKYHSEAQQGGWILITALLGDSLEESLFVMPAQTATLCSWALWTPWA